jgi:hypothetical protein
MYADGPSGDQAVAGTLPVAIAAILECLTEIATHSNADAA